MHTALVILTACLTAAAMCSRSSVQPQLLLRAPANASAYVYDIVQCTVSLLMLIF
jgi:hypothetical protein